MLDRLREKNDRIARRLEELAADPGQDEATQLNQELQQTRDHSRWALLAWQAASQALKDERAGTVKDAPPLEDWCARTAVFHRRLPTDISGNLEPPLLSNSAPVAPDGVAHKWTTNFRQ